MTRTTRERPARSSLSRDTVADRALAIADVEGLEAVTIRRLAAELAVTPMALYWHFKTKDDLLDGAADRVLSALSLAAEPRRTWKEELRDLLDELIRVLRLHPQLADRSAHRLLMTEPGRLLTERALACLLGAGFTSEVATQLAGHALQTVVMLVTDDLVDSSGVSVETREDHMREKRSMLASLSPVKYPLLSAHAGVMTSCSSSDDFFDLGVDHFVAGVAGLLSRRPGRVRSEPAPTL